MDPTNRRSLLGAGAAAAALGGLGAIAAPTAAREIDPELPQHWTGLLAVLGHHDDANGPRAVLDAVQRELRVIAEHRAVARGELRMALMRVEARWTVFAAWLANDTGDVRGREVLLARALRLARESGYADVMALARARRAQWSDAPRALSHAQAGLRTHHAGPQTRAWCASRVAHAHARLGDAEATERMLDEVVSLLSQESPPPPWSRGLAIEQRHVGAWEARCWLALKPAKAIRCSRGCCATGPAHGCATADCNRRASRSPVPAPANRTALALRAARPWRSLGRRSPVCPRVSSSNSAPRSPRRSRRSSGDQRNSKVVGNDVVRIFFIGCANAKQINAHESSGIDGREACQQEKRCYHRCGCQPRRDVEDDRINRHIASLVQPTPHLCAL